MAAAARRASPVPAAGADARVAERERRLAERLLERESLRGALDDATWQPIQDWLLRTAGRLAAATAGLDEPAAEPALDRGEAALMEVAAILASALDLDAGTTGPALAQRLEPLPRALVPPLVDARHARAVHARLRAATRQLAARPEPAPTAAARLVAALEPGGYSDRDPVGNQGV